MIKTTEIKSVLGFNFKADIKDSDGNVLATGARSVFCGEIKTPIVPKMADTSWFTTYDHALLNKIKNCKAQLANGF